MNFKNAALFASVMIPPMVSNHAISADNVTYSTIISKYKEDAGKRKCLRTFSNNSSVSMGDCTALGGSTDYTSMRQWEIVQQSGGFFLLRNKYKRDANKGQCLRTFNGRDDVGVGDCNALGGATDYNSMRLWKIVENGNYVQLQNKYTQDAVKPNCLRTFNNNDSVQMGSCRAQGGASDYTSMRQWMSDVFPFGRPWAPTGIVRIPYSLPEAPKSGFERLSFPMRIDHSPEERGYYYAMQYRFINGNLGYIGLQPRGKNTGLAIFSVFGNGVTPIAAHCTGSADGGAGSSCSKTIDLVFGHTYNLTVKRDEENAKVWRGYVEDTVTGDISEIGAWQPRDGSQGINNSEAGFVEYYPPINACSKIPDTKVFFGAPEADSGISGTLRKPNVYGRCEGLVEFATEENNGGWDVTLRRIN
ncbi:RICIN domain-containing protein [Enterobacter sp. Bisph1]|uniref:DUF3472 domain-containing protein n=1 Tax=Enterobacter sp. Bisph1 TaxID=1274399 RepID=UPI00057C0CAB|nr:RICIN domain-containing protein [Enterobacter sp. Bisph1]